MIFTYVCYNIDQVYFLERFYIMLKIYLFGSLRIERDESQIALSRRKVIAMLAYLAATGQPHLRDKLATLLWPDIGQTHARAGLRRELYHLNNTIGAEYLETTQGSIGLRVVHENGQSNEADTSVWIDVTAFGQHISSGQLHEHQDGRLCPTCEDALQQAAQLYQGDFLLNFSLTDCEEFSEWQTLQTEHLRHEMALATEKLARSYAQQENYSSALQYARRWLAVAPMHEPAHRVLMELYALSGQQAAAIRQYQECVRILDDELKVKPSPETIALFDAIRTRRFQPTRGRTQDRAETTDSIPTDDQHGTKEISLPTSPLDDAQSSLPKSRRAQVSADKVDTSQPTPLGGQPDQASPSHNLPAQTTSFVGRQGEIAAIRQLLTQQTDCRLLTLIGPGGTGKTRLAIEVARTVIDNFDDGVYWIEAASISEDAFMVSAIANILALKLQGGSEPKAELIQFLQGKQLLLSIDNLEHLPGCAALFLDLLRSAPDVTILATSREPLNLQEEWLYPVSGFALPAIDLGPTDKSQADDMQGHVALGEFTPDAIESNMAVQLFVQRARQADASFALTAENAADVIQICQFVDGLPLALELAAAWVRTLTCTEIVEELDRSLDILTAQYHNIPERHRSMSAVLEHSWNFLATDEQRILRRLSVFRGSFGRYAAQTVGNASLGLLAVLADRALLRIKQTDMGTEYSIHELTRQFAFAKLQLSPNEEQETLQAHCHHYASQLKELRGVIKGSEQGSAIATIASELDNIRTAWQYAIAHRLLEPIADMHEALSRFYVLKYQMWEAIEQCKSAIVILNAIPERTPFQRHLLTELLRSMGGHYLNLHELPEAQNSLERGLKLARQGENQYELAMILNGLGVLYRFQNEHQRARLMGEEALGLYEDLGDKIGQLRALQALALSEVYTNEYKNARLKLQRSLELARQISNPIQTASVLASSCFLEMMAGDYYQANKYGGESLAIFQTQGAKYGLPTLFNRLGSITLALGRLEQSFAYYQQGVESCRSSKMERYLGDCLAGLGHVSFLQGAVSEAQNYFEQALAADREISNHAGIATRIGDLGMIAKRMDQTQLAFRQYNDSHAQFKALGDSTGMAISQNRLGHIAQSQGELAKAWRYYQNALQLALNVNAYAVVMEILLNISAWMIEQKEFEQGYLLLAFILEQSYTTYAVKQRARSLWEEATIAPSQDTRDLIVAQAQQMTLEAICSQLEQTVESTARI